MEKRIEEKDTGGGMNSVSINGFNFIEDDAEEGNTKDRSCNI